MKRRSGRRCRPAPPARRPPQSLSISPSRCLMLFWGEKSSVFEPTKVARLQRPVLCLAYRYEPFPPSFQSQRWVLNLLELHNTYLCYMFHHTALGGFGKYPTKDQLLLSLNDMVSKRMAYLLMHCSRPVWATRNLAGGGGGPPLPHGAAQVSHLAGEGADSGGERVLHGRGEVPRGAQREPRALSACRQLAISLPSAGSWEQRWTVCVHISMPSEGTWFDALIL